MTAQDDDKGRDGVIRYSIKARSDLGRFSIDEETGIYSLILYVPFGCAVCYSLSFLKTNQS